MAGPAYIPLGRSQIFSKVIQEVLQPNPWLGNVLPFHPAHTEVKANSTSVLRNEYQMPNFISIFLRSPDLNFGNRTAGNGSHDKRRILAGGTEFDVSHQAPTKNCAVVVEGAARCASWSINDNCVFDVLADRRNQLRNRPINNFCDLTVPP